jgi:two-component system response regulator AtoC
VLAATARSLEDEVQAGRFREDLLYRINVMHLHLPPLRARPDDVAALASFFVAHHSERLGIPADRLPRNVLATLTRYSWPGNVRELQNVLERALILAGGTPDEDHLPEHVRARPGPAPSAVDDHLSVKRRLPALERELIARALERTSGNRSRAAELLDLSPRALFYKLQDYGLG